jgi:phosphate starvation-inducible PhoH-like protein
LAKDDALIFEDNAVAQLVFGQNDRNLRVLEDEVGVEIQARGNRLRILGHDLEKKVAERALRDLYDLAAAGLEIQPKEVLEAVRMTHGDESPAARALQEVDAVEVGRRKRILPRSENQRRYVQAIRSTDLVLGFGPAGTGKTYLAMAAAVEALHSREVGRIILTRPAVEAGESLGYLPGTLTEKIDPYLRPLYDALYAMMDAGEITRRLERGSIEVAPLAYMRGRTLNDAFVILDEAQNTTSEQMRMFLTRLGFDSKAVVNGDPTQIDLPSSISSGLIEAVRILEGIPGIEFIQFDEKDVVRHPLVQEIIRAYERLQAGS